LDNTVDVRNISADSERFHVRRNNGFHLTQDFGQIFMNREGGTQLTMMTLH